MRTVPSRENAGLFLAFEFNSTNIFKWLTYFPSPAKTGPSSGPCLLAVFGGKDPKIRQPLSALSQPLSYLPSPFFLTGRNDRVRLAELILQA